MSNATMTHCLTIQSNSGSYPVHVTRSNTAIVPMLIPYLRSKHVFIISDKTVASLYLANLTRELHAFDCHVFLLPDGETAKNVTNFEQALLALQRSKASRDTTLIALGGGVISDLGGFTAACYQRGIDFIALPTTLLAQVDASVGGKVAVNLGVVKNGVGAFYHPKAVFIALDYLNSLPRRDFISGLGEVAKYAMLGDRHFFDWLCLHYAAVLQRCPDTLLTVVKHCCEQKARIVAADEREQGERALLNLGHTFAHALESATDYRHFQHGEAVAIGLYCCTRLSLYLGYLAESEAKEIELLLNNLSLPYKLSLNINSKTLYDLMLQDKKVVNYQCRFILLRGIGKAFICSDVPAAAVKAIFSAVRLEEG